MKHIRLAALGFALLLELPLLAVEPTIVIEPDAYTNGAVLNFVNPAVNLIIADHNNALLPFGVQAATSIFPFAPPTGTNVFAAGGVPFFNNDRRLRMDFAGLVSTLSIDFQGGSSGLAEQGMLSVYDLNNVLLGSYTTAGLLGGQIETMNITRPNPDIAYAVAWTITANSPFGRLDHLVFNAPIPVPEPSALWIVGAGLVTFFALRKMPARRSGPKKH
jgi:hypothetical protein